MTTTSVPAMPRAIIYRRLSKEKGETALSLTAQRRAGQEAADRLGLEIAATFTDDGVSGGAAIEKRTGLLEALKEIRAGDVLIVARRDRLARDVLLAGWIEKEVRRRGARIVSAAGEANGDDPASELMRTIVDAFSQYERSLIRARTKAALDSKRADNERWCCHAPYGFRWTLDGQLAKDAKEQRTIRLVHDLREQGLSYRQIVAELKRRRRHNRVGGPFVLAQVQRILSANVSKVLVGGRLTDA